MNICFRSCRERIQPDDELALFCQLRMAGVVMRHAGHRTKNHEVVQFLRNNREGAASFMELLTAFFAKIPYKEARKESDFAQIVDALAAMSANVRMAGEDRTSGEDNPPAWHRLLLHGPHRPGVEGRSPSLAEAGAALLPFAHCCGMLEACRAPNRKSRRHTVPSRQSGRKDTCMWTRPHTCIAS